MAVIESLPPLLAAFCPTRLFSSQRPLRSASASSASNPNLRTFPIHSPTPQPRHLDSDCIISCYAGRRATRHRPTLRFIPAIRKPKLQIPHLPVEISPPPPTSIANVGPQWGTLPLCSVSSQRPLRASSAPSALSPLFLRLQKPKRHSRNCAATCILLSARRYLLSPRPQNPTSQKSPSDPANSNPNSHPL